MGFGLRIESQRKREFLGLLFSGEVESREMRKGVLRNVMDYELNIIYLIFFGEV